MDLSAIGPDQAQPWMKDPLWCKPLHPTPVVTFHFPQPLRVDQVHSVHGWAKSAAAASPFIPLFPSPGTLSFFTALSTVFRHRLEHVQSSIWAVFFPLCSHDGASHSLLLSLSPWELLLCAFCIALPFLEPGPCPRNASLQATCPGGVEALPVCWCQ